MMNKSILESFLDQVDTSGEHWIWTGPVIYSGYGKFARILDGKKHWGAHRASYRLFNGPIENDLLVCHSCNIPNCVRPSHLYLDTSLGNTKYSASLKRMRGGIGIRNGSAKLDEEKVMSIRQIYKEGKLSCNKIGKIFGVCGATIHDHIVTGKRWTHVQEIKSNG